MDFIVSGNSVKNIQEKINEARDAGGGRVVLDSIVYECNSSIDLYKNIELHLPQGCILNGSENFEDYQSFNAKELENLSPENSTKYFIGCMNAKNVSITGKGIIDGQALSFFDTNVDENETFAKPKIERPRMIQFLNCENITFSEVHFKDAPNWTFWLRNCSDVVVNKIKITGLKQIPNNDGIDFDCCKNVKVTNSYFDTGDDCLVCRAIKYKLTDTAVCENIYIDNCQLNSHCQGIRMGCPSDGIIRNIHFNNIVFNGVGSGIHFEYPARYLRKNCTGNCDVYDIKITNSNFNCGRYPLRIYIEGGINIKGVKLLHVENCDFNSKYSLFIYSPKVGMVEDILFKNTNFNSQEDENMKMVNTKNIKFDNVVFCSSFPVKNKPIDRTKNQSWECNF